MIEEALREETVNRESPIRTNQLASVLKSQARVFQQITWHRKLLWLRSTPQQLERLHKPQWLLFPYKIKLFLWRIKYKLRMNTNLMRKEQVRHLKKQARCQFHNNNMRSRVILRSCLLIHKCLDTRPLQEILGKIRRTSNNIKFNNKKASRQSFRVKLRRTKSWCHPIRRTMDW